MFFSWVWQTCESDVPFACGTDELSPLVAYQVLLLIVEHPQPEGSFSNHSSCPLSLHSRVNALLSCWSIRVGKVAAQVKEHAPGVTSVLT